MWGIPGQRLLPIINYRFPTSCGQTERWEAALPRRHHILIVQGYLIVLSDIVAIQRKKKDKISRGTITTSTKRPEGTDCWRHRHGVDFFFSFCVCDLCVTKAFSAWLFSITPVCSSECFCCKIIYKIGSWRRGHKMEYLWDLQRYIYFPALSI